MRKKVLSLTLVAAMMAGCLAGCGNADSKDEGTTAAAGDSTQAAAASDDAIQNLIDATTGTVDLSVWASEEDQDLTTQVIEEFKNTSGIRDLEQAAEHLAANALYQIEVDHVPQVTFDAEGVRHLFL